MKEKFKKKESNKCESHGHGCGGVFYGLGFLAALIYYWSTSATFLEGVIGFFKALLWPAFLVYQLLVFIGA